MITGVPKRGAAAHNSFDRQPAPPDFSMLPPSVNDRPLSDSHEADRKLRNGLILANVIAWIMIVAAIRYLFF